MPSNRPLLRLEHPLCARNRQWPKTRQMPPIPLPQLPIYPRPLRHYPQTRAARRITPDCLSFLLSLGIPSDALCVRRAHDSERLAEFAHLRDKVLIGVRPFSGADCIILKLAWRKNLADGVHS